MASILLVEDNDSLRGMLDVLLTESGYEVSETASGKRVWDMYAQGRYDLVITDVVMPDIDGLEVIMELRRFDPNARIIAISAGGHGKAEHYLKTAAHLGAKRTLTKPFTDDEYLHSMTAPLTPLF